MKDIENLPVKIISLTEQNIFILKTREIINARKSDPAADTSALEAEIDRLVYELYGLTEEEVKIVEGKV